MYPVVQVVVQVFAIVLQFVLQCPMVEYYLTKEFATPPNTTSGSLQSVPTQLSPFSSQQLNAFANADEPDAPDGPDAPAGAGAAAAAAGAAQLQTLH